MFRVPQIDPVEEQRRVKAEVRANFIIFGLLCAAIRIAPFVVRKFSS